jgi:hypothetical protein
MASSTSAAAVPALANRPRLAMPSAVPAAARNFFVVLAMPAVCSVISALLIQFCLFVMCAAKFTESTQDALSGRSAQYSWRYAAGT